jgi:hypothetical protein
VGLCGQWWKLSPDCQSWNSYGPNAIALQAQANGQYVCADNNGTSPLIANRGTPGSWETFYWNYNSDGTVSLEANVNGLWVTAPSGGASPLIATSTTVGTSESYTLKVW